jgi:succinyl-diaminopimelate desuccinylase
VEPAHSAVDLAAKLISFRTFPPEGTERPCAEYLAELLAAAGFSTSLTEFEPDRTTLVADLPGTGNKPPICFAGHIDTVPLGTLEWKHDPFGGEIEDGKLYGRGATDMKAGIAAAAVAGLRAAKMKNRVAGVKLIFTAGEELGCRGSLHAANIDAIGQAGVLVIPEPTENRPACCHRGALWSRVTARGVTAHGALPHLGVNAIYKIAEMIGRLQSFDFGVSDHPLLGPATLNVGMVSGGQNINSVPDRASFTIDCRTLPGQAHEELLEDLGSLLGPDAEIEKLVDLPPMQTAPEHPWVQEVRRVAEEVHETELPPEGKLAFTDASALQPAFGNCPTVILGPGIQEMCHKTDEYCHVARIDEAVEIYTRLITNWCCQ